MDKETLSNYGWIVICVLVMVVMIALATPFGSYISEAVQSTTKGLFDVNKTALDSTGLINIDNQEFDVPDMNHGAGEDAGNQGQTPVVPEEPKEITIPELTDGHKIQLIGEMLVVESQTTIADMKLIDSEVVVFKGDNIITDENSLVGTGYTITIYENTYTIVKLGDVNGDGNLSPSDYVKVKNHIMNVSTLSDIFLQSADMNNDGNITPSDYVKIKNIIMAN